MEELKIDLFEPGMSILHRAGLGGLACTLNWIDQANVSQKPEGRWDFDDRSVTLRWKEGGARPFFSRIYELAFRLDAGLIDLPGSYWPSELSRSVKAELQQGMSMTILQFGPNRKTASKALKVEKYEVDDQIVPVEHQDIIGYTHQSASEDILTKSGKLRSSVPISGTIAPGFVQRHVVHKETTFEQRPGLALALHFALVGTLSLPIDRKTAVLIVPDVHDLADFVERRPLLNPGDPKGCKVHSPADAALQAQVRIRASETGLKLKAERCLAILFSPQTWNEKQKTRAQVLEVDPWDDDLDFFETAMKIAELQPRLVLAKPEKKGDPPRPFWSRGVVRPLIAENLARHDRWYKGFRRLVVSPDGTTDEELVRLLSYETKGIHAMIQQTGWQDRGEGVLVESIHEAMRSCFAAIGDEAGDLTTFKNRVNRQRQRWRLAFSGAKTPNDLRAALADLWSRSYNPTLKAEWRAVLPWFCDDERWQLTRDLALLALASYKKVEKPDDVDAPDSAPIPSNA